MYLSQKGWARKSKPTHAAPLSNNLDLSADACLVYAKEEGAEGEGGKPNKAYSAMDLLRSLDVVVNRL